MKRSSLLKGIAVSVILLGAGVAYAHYLEPDPLLQGPAYARQMARQGQAVPVYSYANNSPITDIDPTGQYILIGLCPNWDAALEEARRRAGCATTSPCADNQNSPCQNAIQLCSGGCNICTILNDGTPPAAWIVDNANPNNPFTNPPSVIYAGGHTHIDEQGHAHVTIDQRNCFAPNAVNALAGVLLEEAMHSCGEAGGSAITDASGMCGAASINAVCQ